MSISEKEKRIIDAAIQNFIKYGFRKTTINEIARDAGIAKGTVYLYFKSKDDILLAVINFIGNQALEQFRRAADENESASDKLRALVKTKIFFHNERIRMSGLTEQRHLEFEFMARTTPHVYQAIQKLINTEIELIVKILEEGVSSGEFEIDDIHQTAAMISYSGDSLSDPWFGYSTDIPVERKAKIFIDTILNGLRTRRMA